MTWTEALPRPTGARLQPPRIRGRRLAFRARARRPQRTACGGSCLAAQLRQALSWLARQARAGLALRQDRWPWSRRTAHPVRPLLAPPAAWQRLALVLGLSGLGLGLLLLAFSATSRPEQGRTALVVNLPQETLKYSFPKWGGVVERRWARDAGQEPLCAERLGGSCSLTDWQRFLDGLKQASFFDALDQVNRYANAVRYQDDDTNWGASDYWAAPGEFFARGGDCEDYAVAKYFSLRRLGIPAEQLRIVVLRDTERGLPHAVLSVRWGAYDLVLDNLSDAIRPWTDLPHYHAIYGVNEETFQVARQGQLT